MTVKILPLSLLLLLGGSAVTWSHSAVAPQAERNDSLHAVHYDVHLDITDMASHMITGRTMVTLTPAFQGMTEIKLELMQLTIDSVKIDGEPATSYNYTDPLITVTLSSPVGPSDTLVAEIIYHGIPFHEAWGGFHWSGDYAFNLGVGLSTFPPSLGKTWFPCIDDFQDRATYDWYVTVEDNKTAVCGGTLVSAVDNGNGTRTYHWMLDHTIPTYLASVAAGPYVLINDTFQGMQAAVPITFYVRPADSSHVAGSFVHLKNILSFYESCFGPYPWPRIGYVSTALGAMEHVCNIAYPYGCINGGLTYEYLYAHELSHMWLGDKVTCASPGDMWLNEGWATWCEMFYREGIYGEGSYLDNLNSLHMWVLQYCHTPQGDGQYFALYDIPPEYTYGATVYDKGALVVHTLRNYLGDSLFFENVRGFLEEFAYHHMSSYDLRDYINAHSPVDVTAFFDAWVFSPGFPGFSIDSFNVAPAGNVYDVTVCARQKHKGGSGYADDNRIEVTFMDQNWQTFTAVLHFSGQTGSEVFAVPFEPVAVFPDLYDKTCDATTDAEQVIKNTGDYDFPDTFFDLTADAVGDSAYIRVTHHWVAPDSLKNPVTGLRLSDYRYWQVDGIMPAGFDATGKFQYNRNMYLDNTLITNAEDSLVILYRPDAGHDWQSVEFTRVGIWSIGNMYVPHLQKGEYTLAIWDHSVGTGHTLPDKPSGIRIFPNPSKGYFNFEINCDHISNILIIDNRGNTVDNLPVTPVQKSIKWYSGDLPGGTYYVRLENDDHMPMAYGKLVVIR